MSITAADGTEYLWNGDPAYWTGRAPNLFPYVGRLTNDRYAYGGEVPKYMVSWPRFSTA